MLGLGCIHASAQAQQNVRHGSTRIQNTQPNIIFLLTDDQRWNTLGAQGNAIIQTPHLDSLAQAGILFQNAYVTTSICAVSRASILTGQYESRHHIDDFKTNFTASALAKTYPALLKNAGYNIGFIGKFGVGSHPPDSLFDFFVDTEAGNAGRQPNYIHKESDGRQIHDTDTIGHAIQIFLNEYGIKRRKPFCLSVSFKAPHIQDGHPPKYIVQQRYDERYKNVTIPRPVTAKPAYWEAFPAFFQTDKNVGRARWKALYSTAELFQKSAKQYYALITGVDDVVGKMVEKLKVMGIADRTIIIFMSDNGFMMGAHGLIGKWYGYEESIRVPFFIYSPYLPDKLKQTKPEQIALNIDVAPTILSMAGLPVPDSMQGMDLISMLKHEIPPRKSFFYQHYFWGSPRIPQVEGVVTARFKYMKYIEHDYEELYDVRYDPHETTNLAYKSKYKLILEQLRRRYKALKRLSK